MMFVETPRPSRIELYQEWLEYFKRQGTVVTTTHRSGAFLDSKAGKGPPSVSNEETGE